MITRPMLAAKATEQELQNLFRGGKEFLLSPKIDGIRALVVNGKLMSRTMKPIRNAYTQNLFGHPDLEGLDGELVVGNPWDKDLMQNTLSGVMSVLGFPNVKYHVFDVWSSDQGFTHRHAIELYQKVTEEYSDIVNIVPHYVCKSYEDLLVYEQDFLAKGYEGVMLRSLCGPYKQNRSTLKEAYLVKVKRFHDYEAVIVGYEALQRNLNPAEENELGLTKRSHAASGKVSDELIGSVIVKDLTTGVEFSIGSGFTESLRRNLWEIRNESLVGRVVKYKCFTATGTKDKPRFPIFLGFRDPEDM